MAPHPCLPVLTDGFVHAGLRIKSLLPKNPVDEMGLSPAAVLNTENGHGFTKPGGSTSCPQGNHTYNDGTLSSVLGGMMSKQSLGVRIKGQTCKGDTVQ